MRVSRGLGSGPFVLAFGLTGIVSNQYIGAAERIWTQSETSLILRALGLAAIWLVAVSVVALVYWRLYRRLKSTLERVKMFETVMDQSPVSVVITDPSTNIEFVNPGFTAVTGFALEEVVGKKTSVLKSGETSKETVADLWKHLVEGKAWTGEFINRRKNGELFTEEAHIAPVTDDKGRVTHYVAVKLDISDRKVAEARLARLAHNDALTDIANRALFSDRLRQALLATERENSALAVFYMDLDGFKPINDRYGHAAGDEVLREVARRWTSTVRKGDTVARMGGDEFAVLAPGVRTDDEARLIMGKIVTALKEPIIVSGLPVSVGSSVGWAIFPTDAVDQDSLLRRADEALYADKARRKSSCLDDPR